MPHHVLWTVGFLIVFPGAVLGPVLAESLPERASRQKVSCDD